MLAASLPTGLAPPRPQFLSLLGECRSLRHLKQSHPLLVTSGLPLDSSSSAAVLRFAALSLPGDVAYASLLLLRHPTTTPATSVWNALLQAFSIRSHHETTVSLFTEMLREGAVLDERTYPLVLKAVSRSASRNPSPIHAQVLKLAFEEDDFVCNSLVSAYAKGGDLGSACEVFDGRREKSSVSWSAMIHGYVKNNRALEGLALFAKMKSMGVEVDEKTVASVLKGSGAIGDLWFGRCIHGYYVECGRVRRDVYIGSALVDMYMKCGYCDDARKVFDGMPCRNVVSWSALITGYEQRGQFKDSLSAFRDMFVAGVRPNQVTLTSVLTACAQLGALDQGRWIHYYIERNNMEVNSFLGTALIDMYAKCGCINDALLVFNKLQQKDVYPWTALINGFAMHGRGSECLDTFHQMLEERVTPNEATFSSILSACSHCGMVDQGRAYFYNMLTNYRIKPMMEHYGCMVDLLGRAGHLQEAFSLIKSMPMEPSAAVWVALLGACMIHKDFVLGEKVGMHLIRMQPNYSGAYAILAKIHSLSGNQVEAAHVRATMKAIKVDKNNGCSLIEVDGVTHEFAALDVSHSQLKDVYKALDALTNTMKMES